MSQNNSKNKRIIVVLGMHRSGTSAIMKAIETLGVSLGENLMVAAKGNNEKGFFEDVDIYALNEQMLSALHNQWHELSFVGQDNVDYLCSEGYLEKAVDLLKRKLATTDVFGFKEPRTTKLIIFWKKVFSCLECDVNYILALRNPHSVAMSLQKRDSMDVYQGELLWLSYQLSALCALKDDQWVILNYDFLVEQPEYELLRLARILNLPVDRFRLNEYVKNFIDQSLRHFGSAGKEKIAPVNSSSLAGDIYAGLLEYVKADCMTSSTDINNKILIWQKEYNGLCAQFSYVDKLNKNSKDLIAALSEKSQQLDRLTTLTLNNSDKYGNDVVEVCAYFGLNQDGNVVFDESYSSKSFYELGQGKITHSFFLPELHKNSLPSVRFDISNRRCLANIFDVTLCSVSDNKVFWSWKNAKGTPSWGSLTAMEVVDVLPLDEKDAFSFVCQNNDPQIIFSFDELNLNEIGVSNLCFRVTFSLYSIELGQEVAFGLIKKIKSQMAQLIENFQEGFRADFFQKVEDHNSVFFSAIKSELSENTNLFAVNVNKALQGFNAQGQLFSEKVDRLEGKINMFDEIFNAQSTNYSNLNMSLDKSVNLNVRLTERIDELEPVIAEKTQQVEVLIARLNEAEEKFLSLSNSYNTLVDVLAKIRLSKVMRFAAHLSKNSISY